MLKSKLGFCLIIIFSILNLYRGFLFDKNIVSKYEQSERSHSNIKLRNFYAELGKLFCT